jgi:molecular chaperone DnaK
MQPPLNNPDSSARIPGLSVGIDLGTTFSAIAHVDAFGKPVVIPNAESERITPSVILFDGENAIVGSVAQQNAVAEPEKIVDFVKREMGKSKEAFHRVFGSRQYSAEELSSLIVRKLVADAEKYLGERVTDAVITVPAYFNDAERTATIRAGQLAGINVLQVINEPTAAALAYGLDKLDKDQTVFVFDLGGGTFDVTIMRVEKGNLRMVASNGDHRLGGKDWDDVILQWVAGEFDNQYGDNPLLDLQSYQDLHTRARTAKIQLSARDQTTLVHAYNGKSIKLQITRAEFEQRCQHLLYRCRTVCEIVMQEAQLTWKDIDSILLTGGMTRVPSILALLEELAPDVPITRPPNPDEAVARGAAIQAMISTLAAGGPFDAPELKPVLTERFTSPAGELVNVTNVTTHTLGVVLWDHAKVDEYAYPMIPKSTALPATESNTFGLSKPGLRKVTVRIVEGESTVPAECSPLGTCDVILPRDYPAGTPVKVTYGYDESQVLEVEVEIDGERVRSVINRASGATPEEISAISSDLFKLRVC